MASLTSFTVENFLSFSSAQTIGFGKEDMRPITAIFGPNAGGKSNLFKALSVMKQCVFDSTDANWKLPYRPFLLNERGPEEPSGFSVRFRVPEGVFEYGFKLNGDCIIEERLREQPGPSRKMRTVFHRSAREGLSASAGKFGFGKKLLQKTRPTTLLITKAREDNNPYANAVFGFFDKLHIDLDATMDNHGVFVTLLNRDDALRKRTLELLRMSDFAIRDLSVDEVDIPDELIAALPIPEEARVKITSKTGYAFLTHHAIRNEAGEIVGMRPMDFWSEESLGTRQFLRVAVRILNAVDKGYLLFIDEFATSVHSDLIQLLFKLVEEEGMETGARLVVNTQNTAVMNAGLDRDAIVLIEKGLSEQSVIIPLADRHAREHEAFEKRYREGLYGGVPFVQRG